MNASKQQNCTCNYCIDNYFTAKNTNSKCPNYKQPTEPTEILNCPICFQEILLKKKAKCAKCNKTYCWQCINNWKNKDITAHIQYTCPFCRTLLKTSL